MKMADTTFICKRCGHDAKYKQALEKHLMRRVPCQPSKMAISTTDLLNELKPKYNDDAVHCEYCKKKFNSKFNLQTHLKTCKIKLKSSTTVESLQTNDVGLIDRINVLEKENRDLSDKFYRYEKEMTERIILYEQEMNLFRNFMKTHYDTTDSQNTVQTSTKIQLNNFGQETLEHITEEFLSNCMMNDLTGAKQLIEKIHFCNEVPENKNVRMKSLKRKVVEVTENSKWIKRKAEEIIDEMIRKCFKILIGYSLKNDSDFHQKNERIQEKIRSFLNSLRDKSNNSPYHTLKERIMILIEDNTI